MIMPILSVSNFAASKKFYTETLGFSQGVSMKDDNDSEVFGIFDLGQAHLGLAIDPNLTTPVGATAQFMIYVSDDMDIDRYYADVKARGGAAADLKTEYWGDRKFDIHDPDGYYLTLCKTVKPMTPEEAAKFNATLTPSK